MLAHPLISWLIHTDLVAANGGYGSKMSPHNHGVPFGQSERDVIDPTNSRRAFDDCVEYGLHVCRRTANDAKHLRCRRLMLQGFPQLGIALLQFLEEADILDGDH